MNRGKGQASRLAGLGGAISGRTGGTLARLPVFVLLFTALRAEALTANDDLAYTVPNQPVTIAVLGNDSDAATNQCAILQVGTPSHGSVRIDLNSVALNPRLSALFEFAAAQLSNSVMQVANADAYPRSTRTNGTWITRASSDWISGFFPGCLWYLYQQGGQTPFRTWAENWTSGIASQQYATDNPDLGFMFNNSLGAGYRLTGNPAYPPILLQAARSLVAVGYNPAVGCLGLVEANHRFRVIIDFLMNTELLYREAELSGERILYTNAYRHAETSMLNHVRADGSTYQQVVYNSLNGAVVSRGTSDGASDSSTWARGQGWAIYGFTMAYRETRDARFLVTAQRLADYFFTNAPADHVPYWDFQAPGIPNAARDSSAAAITLAALAELSQLATNQLDRARYWDFAAQIFDSLASTNYLAQGSVSSGILLHGTGEPPKYSWGEVDVSLVYGDYYFIEALRRLTDFYRRTTLTYVPGTNFQGTDTFTCQIGNNAGESATASVTVLVNPAYTNAFTEQIALSPGTRLPTISFPGIAGREYFIQCSTNLSPEGQWRTLSTNLLGSGCLLCITDTNAAGRCFYRIGVEPPPPPPQIISLNATQGVIASPFIIGNGYIYQPLETGVAAGGRAAYSFTVPTAGNYVIQTLANAPNDGANSFYVNLDAEPQDPYMIWDIPLTSGFQERRISWRGNGTFDDNEFVPKVFALTQGSHQLILRGREANTLLQSLAIMPYP